MSNRFVIYFFLVLSPFLLGSEGCRRDFEFAPDASAGDSTSSADTPTISFSNTEDSQLTGTVDVVVQLSATTTDDVTAQLSLSGSATEGTDYTISVSEVTITKDSTTTQFSIAILSAATTGDTVSVTLTSPTNATIGTASRYTLTIGDSSSSSVGNAVDLDSTTASLGVGNTLDVGLLADNFFSSSTTVTFTTTGGTAASSDFSVSPSSFVFSANSDAATVTVSADSNATVGETIVLALQSGSSYDLGTDTSITITLTAATSSATSANRSVGDAVLEGLIELQNNNNRIANVSVGNNSENLTISPRSNNSSSSAANDSADSAGNWLGDQESVAFSDQDNDGFTDQLEDQRGTDATSNSSQPTGFTTRLINRFIGIDDDLDGLTNQQELDLGSNPKLADSDSNGRSDGAEFLSTGSAQGNTYLDSDSDGLSDDFEVSEGTSSVSKDTDNDGLTDSQELALGTSSSSKDTDGDGIFDGREVLIGTDPVIKD